MPCHVLVPRLDEVTGSTFTITNLGMHELDAFTPLINLLEAAISGVGRIKARPAVVDGDITVRQMMWLSLTFDHRLVDGAPAARFLQRIKQLVDTPSGLRIGRVVVSEHRRSPDERYVVAWELVLRQQFAQLHLNQIEQVGIVDQVALVHEHDHVRHVDLAS